WLRRLGASSDPLRKRSSLLPQERFFLFLLSVTFSKSIVVTSGEGE
ncbi:unnamed protein product, partial [Brassica oleracea var. botrytis]